MSWSHDHACALRHCQLARLSGECGAAGDQNQGGRGELTPVEGEVGVLAGVDGERRGWLGPLREQLRAPEAPRAHQQDLSTDQGQRGMPASDRAEGLLGSMPVT